MSRTPIIAILGGAFLFSSKAFIDYSTSGLENPLSHFLLVLFMYIGLIDQKLNPKNKATAMGLIVAFIGLARVDLLLLVLPFFVWWLRKEARATIRASIIAALLPLLAWEVFSIIYYGFPIPNTAYAKLNQGIVKTDLIEQGVYYLFNTILWDPATLSTIGLGVLLSFSNRDRGVHMIAIGTLVYLCYVVWIGGDFMSGRFFSCLLVINVAMILLLSSRIRKKRTLS
jgi:arabinofuranosyltransferase